MTLKVQYFYVHLNYHSMPLGKTSLWKKNFVHVDENIVRVSNKIISSMRYKWINVFLMSFQNILNNNIQQYLTPICLINNVIFILLSFKPKKKSIFCNQLHILYIRIFVQIVLHFCPKDRTKFSFWAKCPSLRIDNKSMMKIANIEKAFLFEKTIN